VAVHQRRRGRLQRRLGELLISKSAVSDLSDIAVEYLFCDAILESLRRQDAKEALLVAWRIHSDGRKHLLHLAVGNMESEAAWTEFFRNMIALQEEIENGSDPREKAIAHAFVKGLVVEERDTIRPSFYVRGDLPPDLEPQTHNSPARNGETPSDEGGGFSL
jgi:hypothetical protein